MKFTSPLLLAAAVLAFSACSENTTETETTTTETAATETVTTDPFAGATISDSVAASATNLDASAPAPTTETQVFQGPNTVAGKPADAASAGVNPAHGQPGHDCAIPVGAPLGSKPAASASPQLKTTPATTTITPTPTPAPTAAPSQNAVAAGLNPAHGQPGHDCAIPVGAPLKK